MYDDKEALPAKDSMLVGIEESSSIPVD